MVEVTHPGRPTLHGFLVPATQTITATAFTIEHNQRNQIDITCTGTSQTYTADTTTGIRAGVIDGQILLVHFLAPATNTLAITDAGNVSVKGTWERDFSGSWIRLLWDASGATWVELERDKGELLSASGQNANAEGNHTTADGDYSHAEGNATTASGEASHAEGASSVATGDQAHAEGLSTTADGTASHSEGSGTTASGQAAHAEGRETIASGLYAHAEGQSTTASGNRAHAEGNSTTASGLYSHAQGSSCLAIGDLSHAQGYQARANLYAEDAHAASRFAAHGDAQYSRVVMRIGTTDATLTELFIDGVDDRLTILNEYTYSCKVEVVGRQDTGVDHFMGEYSVLIQRTDSIAGVALVGAATPCYENNPGGWGAGGGLPVEITAANNALTIKVEGLANHNIRWCATVDMRRVGYPKPP